MQNNILDNSHIIHPSTNLHSRRNFNKPNERFVSSVACQATCVPPQAILTIFLG